VIRHVRDTQFTIDLEIVKDPSPKHLFVEKSAMPFHIASSPSSVNFEAIAIELENQNKELKRQLESVMQINKRMQLFKTEEKKSFDVKSIPCFRCDGAILGLSVC